MPTGHCPSGFEKVLLLSGRGVPQPRLSRPSPRFSCRSCFLSEWRFMGLPPSNPLVNICLTQDHDSGCRRVQRGGHCGWQFGCTDGCRDPKIRVQGQYKQRPRASTTKLQIPAITIVAAARGRFNIIDLAESIRGYFGAAGRRKFKPEPFVMRTSILADVVLLGEVLVHQCPESVMQGRVASYTSQELLCLLWVSFRRRSARC